MRIYLDTTLQELLDAKQISARTYNSLRLAGLTTLQEVLNHGASPAELKKLRNFGSKCYAEILPLLREVMAHEGVMKPVGPKEVFDALGVTIGGMLEETYEELIEEENNVTKSFKACYPSVIDLHMGVRANVKSLLRIHSELSMTENQEIRRMYVRYLEGALNRMRNAQLEEHEPYAEYLSTLTELQPKVNTFTYAEKAEHFIRPSVRNLLQSLYMELCENLLGTRARNYLAQVAPRFETLAPFFGAKLQEYKKLSPGQYLKKTLTEVCVLNIRLHELFDRYWQMSDEEVQTVQLKREYPFLSDEDRILVEEHIRAYGTPPMFFLLYNYMRSSEERNDKIFNLLFGILDGKEHTNKEVGAMMNVTSERIRQVMGQKLEVHTMPLMQREAWQQYGDLFALPFVTAETPEYQQLTEREHLFFGFRIFARLMQLLGERDFEVTTRNGNGDTIQHQFTNQYATVIVDEAAVAINRMKMPTTNVGDCVGLLRTLMETRSTGDRTIPLEALLKEVNDEEKAEAVKLITYIAKAGLGLEVNESGEVIVPKNSLDVAEELYLILAQKGEPMSVDELFSAFKQRYPDHKYTDSTRIRPYLFRHPHMKPLGNTSRYGLDTWEHIFYGTIRDLLIKTLEQSDQPMHIQQIHQAVVVHFPNTKPQNLESSMAEDTYDRFIHFKNGYYGLRSKAYDEAYQKSNEVRQSFEERFADFRKFVAQHNRYPISNRMESEASLQRWMYNVQNGVLAVTNEQRQQLETAMKADEMQFIPRNATEYTFRENCQAYKAYFDTHHTQPTPSKAPELHSWMARSKAHLNSYTDHRKKYLTDLLNYLQPIDFFGTKF